MGFLSILGDWKIILAILIAIGAGVIIFKINGLEGQIAADKITIKQEQDNNVVLRGNVTTLTQINQSNQQVIEQQARTNKITAAAVSQLAQDVKNNASNFGAIQSKLDSIVTPPSALSPYFKDAINGIQTERAKLNPPSAKPVEQPK